MLQRMQEPIPCRDPEEANLNPRMRVHKVPGDPGRHLGHCDPQLFLELTHQRLGKTFSCLDLAARKLPVTGIGLARRTLRQQIPWLAVLFSQNHRR